MTEHAANRYIRGRCPVCQTVSPVCDQQEDIRRETISDWWFPHFNEFHRFGPVFERVTPAHIDGTGSAYQN